MSKVINTEKLAVKESTYLKNPAKYNAKSKNRPVVIRRDDGSTIELKDYRLRPIYVKERYYLFQHIQCVLFYCIKICFSFAIRSLKRRGFVEVIIP